MYSYLYGALWHILEVMSFVDVDGTLTEVMYTILVYLFCAPIDKSILCVLPSHFIKHNSIFFFQIGVVFDGSELAASSTAELMKGFAIQFEQTSTCS